MLNTFSKHLDLSADDVSSLLANSLPNLLKSQQLQDILGNLNTVLLKESLPTAGTILAAHLPPFYDWLKNDLGLERVPDSPSHTTIWVTGFLGNQETIGRLVEMHQPIPRASLELAIPRLVSLFDEVEPLNVRQEWQQAIASLCLVLAVAARIGKKIVVLLC